MNPAKPAPRRGWDAWAWLAPLATIGLWLHARGAPLGEPIAEDFDYLHHARFTPGLSLFDGGGSAIVWRPFSIQLYYELLGGTMLDRPEVVAALHLALLACATWLIYRAMARGYPRPWAAFIATMPLFSESMRMSIAWPANFGEIAVWFWTALALHQMAARRLGSTLLALLMALLSKEVAVVAALLLPWIPRIGPGDLKARLRWALAMAGVTAGWAAIALAVRVRAGLALPFASDTPFPAKLAWAFDHIVRALFSLPAIPVREAAIVLGAAALLGAAAVVIVLLRAGARARLRRYAAAACWGAAWLTVVAAATTRIHPDWSPNRSAYASLGFGVAAASVLGSAHPALLAGLAGVRVLTFAMSPRPPREISAAAPAFGASVDFPRLVRLQLLTRGIRSALHDRLPRPQPGSRFGTHYLPLGSEYAFGRGRAIQVWYGDTTLAWSPLRELRAARGARVDLVVEFEDREWRPIAIVEGPAMEAYFDAGEAMDRSDWESGLRHLARADTLQRDTTARVFRGLLAADRAQCWLSLERFDRAEAEGRRGVDLWTQNVPAHWVLGWIAVVHGRLEAARRHVDYALTFAPEDAHLRELRMVVAHEESSRGR